MSKTLDSNKFADILYNSLPEIYRSEDADVGHTLKRYIEALNEGGFSKVIEEINGLLTLIDSEKVDEKLLPIMFRSYGLEMFNGVPEAYLRKLLPMISKLFSMKGSITAIEYLTSLISGVKSEVKTASNSTTDHSIDVVLEMDYGAEQSKELPDREQLLRIVEEFVPFFCDVTIIYAYFFEEQAKVFLQDSFYRDLVTYITGEQAVIVSEEEELTKDIKYSVSEGGNLAFADLNSSVLGRADSVLSSTFILNNIGSYDIIKKTNGEKELFFN